MEFSLAHQIPVACFSCHKINKFSISWLNYNRKQEILLKNLLQNQQNLNASGIYSGTGIYFFKSAQNYFSLFSCIFLIAQEEGISRQGVYDSIRRSTKQLREYEERLGLVEKFEKQKKLAKKIHQQLQELPLEKENNHLEKINEMLQEILEE